MDTIEDGSLRNAAKTGIQQQIIDNAVDRLSKNCLFSASMLNLLNSESLLEPWCNQEQLDRIIKQSESEPKD